MSEFETMQEKLESLVPKEMAGAVNMLAHPVAGAAAMSALGLGVASHMLGVWMGTLTGLAEASQRLADAQAGGPDGSSAATLAKARARAKALMEQAQAEARTARQTVQPLSGGTKR